VAQASLEEAQEAVKLADAELLRLKQAAAKGPGLVSAQETARAEGAARTARARLKKEEAALALLKAGAPTGRLQVARAEVTLRQVEVAQAKALLDAATVRAPLDGTVLKLNVRVGEFVSPQASGIATPGSICELGDMSSLEVDVAVHERNLARVFKGQRCEVRLDAFPDTAYRAVVERVSPTVDRGRNTVTVRVRLELPKKDQTLPVDASAVVRFLPR
jgi:HlyD family secretion protein